MKNILLITDLYPIKDEKTIPCAIENFALALNESGSNITVIRPNFLLNTVIRKHNIYPDKKYIRNNIEIYNKNFILPFVFNNFKPEKKFDIIISHLPSGHMYANLINKTLKIPHIAILHQSDYEVLKGKIYRFCFKNKLKKAVKDAVIVGARNKFLKEKFNADFILPSFVDKKDVVQNKKTNSKKLKIITVSRLIKRKNIDIVIKALKKADFDFEYNIIGEGKEEKNLKRLIKKYNLESNIKLRGKIEHNKIYKELDKNDIFILPSIKETFGISYLEAMARGLIVIGTKNTGIDGIISNNENGYLVNPNEDEILEIFKKIKNNAQDEIIKNSLLSMENYTKEVVIKKYNDIIASCTKK